MQVDTTSRRGSRSPANAGRDRADPQQWVLSAESNQDRRVTPPEQKDGNAAAQGSLHSGAGRVRNVAGTRTEARSKAFGGLRQQRVDDGAIDIDNVTAIRSS